MRTLARGLAEAYDSPISTHIVGPDFAVRSTFVGNSMFEGNDYRAFLEEALAGFDEEPDESDD